MLVEFLTVSVDPDELPEWLEVEAEVWSRYFVTLRGFIRNEVWRPADRPGTKHAVILGESREAREYVGADKVAAVDERVGNWLCGAGSSNAALRPLGLVKPVCGSQ
jgi:hypothetical protein